MSKWKCYYYGILSGLQVLYPLTLEAEVLSQASLLGVDSGKSGTGTDLLQVLQCFPDTNIRAISLLYTCISIIYH